MKEIRKILLEKYRGLREEDLSEMNEEYSCIVCANSSCSSMGKAEGSCPDHVVCPEEDFAKRYNFK